MKTKLALIDADSMIYIVAWKFRNKNIPNLVKMNINSFIHDILQEVGATHYLGFYGSTEEGVEPNFRYDLVDDYKSTRPETPDFIIKWRPTIHAQMRDKWGFQPIDGMEADDAVAIANSQFKNNYDSIVVITADKDLKQIANTTHFDMNKRIYTEINQFEADKFFSEQMLKGDPGDNIKGLPGIGPKKAVNLLKLCTNSIELKWTVIRMYNEHFTSIRAKIERDKSKEIEAEWITENSLELETKGFTTKQIARKCRLFVQEAIKDKITDEMPYTWKEYIVQQYRLLRMLEIAPDGFVLNDIREFELAEKESVSQKSGIEDIMSI